MPTLNDKLASYLEQRPHQWIDGRELAQIAGVYAWRSRVSNLRRGRGMTIENRVRHLPNLKISEYRYVPEASA